jgi:hypothetical protein
VVSRPREDAQDVRMGQGGLEHDSECDQGALKREHGLSGRRGGIRLR